MSSHIRNALHNSKRCLTQTLNSNTSLNRSLSGKFSSRSNFSQSKHELRTCMGQHCLVSPFLKTDIFNKCKNRRPIPLNVCFMSSEATLHKSKDDEIQNNESGKDSEKKEFDENKDLEKREFQAETKMLLDIVAKSLYSDKEVFIRELISNASDSLEKLRYFHLRDGVDSGPLEVKISTDKQARTLIIEDSGVGMTKEELVTNLGTIARSGSKAFLEEIKKKGGLQASSVIGQFGVGFYSAFMVADSVEVYSKSYRSDSPPCKWTSDGSGSYTMENIDDCNRGLKIVIHLKTECREFADGDRVKEVIKKYSNFINAPIIVDGRQVNTIQPLWIMDPKSITPEMHHDFYKFVSNSYDKPRYILHIKVDVPISVQALLYVGEGRPGLFDLNKEGNYGIALYAKRVLIKSQADNIVPKWLRFVKGVVDCEDIPLNLSRELLQNSALISKIKTLVTNKVLKFLYDKSTKEKEDFAQFYRDYSIYLKEGVVRSENQLEKEEISRLLRYESSTQPAGTSVSLSNYCSRRKADQKQIFYLIAPNRSVAENSPYLEALKGKNVEVLFCYEPHDEVVFLHLRQFNGCRLSSVESEIRNLSGSVDQNITGKETLAVDQARELISWLETTFKNRIHTVRLTGKLDTHPCVITVEEMAAARHFLKTQSHLLKDNMKFSILQPALEINPRHPIIKKLSILIKTNPELAALVAEQLHSNALVFAGLLEDPRTVLTSMNRLLELTLQKH